MGSHPFSATYRSGNGSACISVVSYTTFLCTERKLTRVVRPFEWRRLPIDAPIPEKETQRARGRGLRGGEHNVLSVRVPLAYAVSVLEGAALFCRMPIADFVL